MERAVDIALTKTNLIRLGTWYLCKNISNLLQRAGAVDGAHEDDLWNKIINFAPPMSDVVDHHELFNSTLVVGEQI